MAMSPRLLRPKASGSHPDAQAWRNAVVSNGGSVSSSTLKAVNDFCKSIDAAGIRDKFYRLNLFCGTGLEAALVPLYRGASRTGTQYGNTTDTNVNFVSGDYVETGSTAGLTGNGSTKYLNTGLAPNAVTEIGSTGHLAVHGVVNPSTSGNAVIGTDNGSTQFYWLRQIGATLYRFSGTYGGTVTSGNVDNSWLAGSFVLQTRRSATDLETLVNAASVNTVTTSASPSAIATAFYVFAGNRNNSPIIHAANTLGGYSIGASMTSAQVSSYYTAMKTFQAALGRSAA